MQPLVSNEALVSNRIILETTVPILRDGSLYFII